MADQESVMTAAQRDAVGAWFRATMDALRLHDWTITIGHEPPAEDDDGEMPWASTTCCQYPESVIRVDARVFGESAEVVERVLLHELLHIYHADMLPAVEEQIQGPTDPAMNVLGRYTERWVDTLARVLQDVAKLPVTVGPILKAEKPAGAGPVRR